MKVYTQARGLVHAVTTWHVTSAQVARRNALVSSTALAQTRAEQRDVEEFLAAHAARRSAASTGSPARTA